MVSMNIANYPFIHYGELNSGKFSWEPTFHKSSEDVEISCDQFSNPEKIL